MAGAVHVVNTATPRLRELSAGLAPARVHARIAPAVVRLFADHLGAKEAGGYKQGWPSQHFYAGCVRSLTGLSDAAAAYVSINKQGFLQRLYGGVIKPVTKKLLAIPARAEAYGKRAEEFGNLKVQFGRRGDGSIGPVALVAKEGGATVKVFRGREASGAERPVRGAEEGMVMFWLVKEVHQAPDPSIVPTDAAIIDTATQAVASYVQYLKRRNN